MLKLLFKPTGNIFTLPDEEVLKIKAQDRANEYEILDAGLQEEKVEKVTKEEANKLVKAKEEKIAKEKEEVKAKEAKRVAKEKKSGK